MYLTDARILRELDALCALPDVEVHAFGVDKGPDNDAAHEYALRQFNVFSAKATRLPRPVRYFLVLLEVNTRFILSILRLRPDIVHCHDAMVLPSGAFAKILARSTVVYDARQLRMDRTARVGRCPRQRDGSSVRAGRTLTL